MAFDRGIGWNPLRIHPPLRNRFGAERKKKKKKEEEQPESDDKKGPLASWASTKDDGSTKGARHTQCTRPEGKGYFDLNRGEVGSDEGNGGRGILALFCMLFLFYRGDYLGIRTWTSMENLHVFHPSCSSTGRT